MSVRRGCARAPDVAGEGSVGAVAADPGPDVDARDRGAMRAGDGGGVEDAERDLAGSAAVSRWGQMADLENILAGYLGRVEWGRGDQMVVAARFHF